MAERRDTDVLFKALADPSRRRLLDLLHATDGQTLRELCEELEITPQGVTQQLALLEAADALKVVPAPQNQRPPGPPLAARENQLLHRRICQEISITIRVGRLDLLGAQQQRIE